MLGTRRPVRPAVFLCLLAAASGAAPPTEDLSSFWPELERSRRLRLPANAPAEEALAAYRTVREALTRQWAARWPDSEPVWRERLRALAEAPDAPRWDVAEALDRAEGTVGADPALRFAEDTRLLLAALAIRRRVGLERVPGWLDAALERAAAEAPPGEQPLIAAARRETLAAAARRDAVLRAELAEAQGELPAMLTQIERLAALDPGEPADPGDRLALAERAHFRVALHRLRARAAALAGDREAARSAALEALAARPVTPGEPEPPANRERIAEARRAWLDAGRPAADFEAELAARPGAALPPAAGAPPRWTPARQPLPQLAGAAPRGTATIVAVYNSGDPAVERALERLQREAGRHPGLAVATVADPAVEWLAAVNPLDAGPQLWLADAAGQIRLVGRLQPTGDGWARSILAAAQRLDRPEESGLHPRAQK